MRCFVAIALPDDVKRCLAALLDRMEQRGARQVFRMVARDNWHLTLRFLGDLNEATLTALRMGLASCCAGWGCISLNVARVGGFPSIQSPKVVWAGVEVVEGELLGLQRRIETAAVAVGLAPETRPFAPHITLGRQRDTRQRLDTAHLLDTERDASFGAFTARTVTLFSSELGSGPPRYRVIEEFPLT